MKKLTISIILAALASAANAGLKISVNGVVDPCDSDIRLMPSDTAAIGIVGDGGTQSPTAFLLLVQGPGSIECGNILYPDSDCSVCEDCEDLPYMCPPPELVEMFPGLADLVFITLCDFAAPPAPLAGLLVDDIIFHCEADADVTITLLDLDSMVVYDTRVIHQGPPPPEPKTYHVDTAGGSDTNDGLSRQTAFATIQKGIDTAQNRDTVLVWPGLYSEFINFSGKAITVKSAADAAVIEAPGADAVTFHAGEGPDSVLKNFVIRNSAMAVSLNYGSSPTITNLTIVKNDFGIAAYENSSPDITNCIFADNKDGDLYGCTARHSCVSGQFEDGQVARWKFDEGAGSTAYDSVGGNNGTLYGGEWIAGKVGGALGMDGIDDYVEVPDHPDLRFNQYDSFSISLWARPRSNEFNWLVCKMRSGYRRGIFGYELGWRPSQFTFDTEKSYVKGVLAWTGDNSAPAGDWYHVTAVYNRKELEIYLDGRLKDTAYFGYDTGTTEPDKNLTIGARSYDDTITHYLGGDIDEVMIFDRALSAKEIENIYQGRPITRDPLFADPCNGDYHLKSEHGRYWPQHDIWVLDNVTSPCIDAGDPEDDYSAELRPNGGRINMGAYGGTTFAARGAWQPSGDLNDDGLTDMRDVAVVADNWLKAADTLPPAPDPPQWATTPHAVWPDTIVMAAKSAADESEVEYYFECVSGPGHDSGWQEQVSYVESNLEPDTEYCYRLGVRDRSPARNQTAWSEILCATTPPPPDTTPPSPDPMQWDATADASGFDGQPREIFVGPDPAYGYAATMRAARATDASGPVEYFFECTSNSGFSSEWQSSPKYAVSVGRAAQELVFRVKARDLNANETAYSPSEAAVPRSTAATDPNPPDDARNVAKYDNYGLLSWSAGDGAEWHHVYFGTNPNPGEQEFRAKQPLSNVFFFIERQADTTYYWRIDEQTADGAVTTGPLWSFTTAPSTAYSPDPPDGATNVPTNPNLAWGPGFGAFSYDVYLGTVRNYVANAGRSSREFMGNLAVTRFTPPVLPPGMTWYWRIDSLEPSATYKGSVWSFTTLP
jgi:parallel beta-helix repeat protein